MSLDVAYAVEIDDFIDPDRAYELFWSGILTDKKAFICPGENCTAQVTCANLDEESQNMKVVPHFRVYGTHANECEIIRNIPLKINKVIELIKKQEKISIDHSIVDSFSLVRPDSYYDTDKIVNNSYKNKSDRKKYKLQSMSANLKHTGNLGKIYSVRSIVSRYLRYYNDGSVDRRKINVSGKDFSYKEFLRGIYNQPIDDLSDYPVVYYGWAYIDKYEKAYRVKFKKKILVEEKEVSVSFFIPTKLIDNYPIKKLVVKRIQKISKQSKPTAFVFIYAKPKVVKSKTNDMIYINFNVDNLDFIDINIDTPLPKKNV
ncbi:hypothetical protein [Pectobacterium brasiliense]|uniref:hypothetical protein n=1 Tax=Pectobacterium brasiliense TaxID=180957 RepID=UPI0004E74D0C|nr:hypothetical protein [Pectobacterium brasiliense]KFF70887.1 hypothetical protein IW00_03435 [Pectobacterium brasiliense]